MPFLPARPRRPTSSGKQAAMAKAAPVSASSSTSTLGLSRPRSSQTGARALQRRLPSRTMTGPATARNSKRCVECLAKGAGQVDPFAPVVTSKSTLESGDPPSRTMARMWPYCPALSWLRASARIAARHRGSAEQGCTAGSISAAASPP